MKKDISLETIEQGLRDSDCDVRAAAMNACQINGIEPPIIRTFEPPKKVYKKCFMGVIISAKIPDDAQVMGAPGRKCRASKAIITGVAGDVCGEPVGISLFDKKTTYYAGDEVVIDDFDFGGKECSTGFHFFCTLEEAQSYVY